MTILDVIKLFGGLGLFLYGMSSMGASLERLASGKTENILKRLTGSLPKGVLLGTAVTAIIQSSSATTVIIIALVNSGVMKLSQAVGVIMGANIGTTITAQIIRLTDISGSNLALQLVKPASLAPLAIAIGAVLTLVFKSARQRSVGQILLGFGILFTGLLSMESAVAPLRSSPWFQELFKGLSNPFLGVLAGLGVTAVIQSSSASVGILQALTSTGLITWASAVPIILGQNIGTCVTGLIASSGASRSAKRVAFVHIYYNVIGTLLALVVVYALKAFGALPFWNNVMNMGDIANFHTLFNVFTTIIFMPLSRVLVRLSELTVPAKEEQSHPELDPTVLDKHLYTSPSLAIGQARAAVYKMLRLSTMIVDAAPSLLITNDAAGIALANQRESYVDKMEIGVTDYLVGLAHMELTEREALEVTDLLRFESDFERISDYAINVVERAGEVFDKHITFSSMAQKELSILQAAVLDVLAETEKAFETCDLNAARRVEPLEETVDEICKTLHDRHIARLSKGLCSVEAGIIFLEVIVNYERISDHCSDVAARIYAESRGDVIDLHKLLNDWHLGGEPEYNQRLMEYKEKYRLPDSASMGR